MILQDETSQQQWKSNAFKYRKDLSSSHTTVFFGVRDIQNIMLEWMKRIIVVILNKMPGVMSPSVDYVAVHSEDRDLLQSLSWQGRLDGQGILGFVMTQRMKTAGKVVVTGPSRMKVGTKWDTRRGCCIDIFAYGVHIHVSTDPDPAADPAGPAAGVDPDLVS